MEQPPEKREAGVPVSTITVVVNIDGFQLLVVLLLVTVLAVSAAALVHGMSA
jgi:hypothetical protein